MVFWGVEVKPGKPFTLKANDATENRKLHIFQATLGLGNATVRSILQCNVGDKSPLILCVLSPGTVDSCQLNLEFEEDVEVIFSVLGPRSIHLTGYFLVPSSTGFRLSDDESEPYGEDIGDTDMEKGSSDDYDYSDSFINDDDPYSDVFSTDDDEVFGIFTVDKRRRLRKKFQDSSNGNDNDHKIPNALSSEVPLPSTLTGSKARSSTLDNGEPNAKCEVKTHTKKTRDQREDTPLDDVELLLVEKGCEIIAEKKQNKESVANNLDEGEGEHIPQNLQS